MTVVSLGDMLSTDTEKESRDQSGMIVSCHYEDNSNNGRGGVA